MFLSLLMHKYIVSTGIFALVPMLGTMVYAQDTVNAVYGEPTGKPSESIQRIKPVGYTDEVWKMRLLLYKLS